MSVTPEEKLDLWLENGQNGIINTEFYLAHVATRCIIIVDSPALGFVGMVFIGMTEVSSCTMMKEKGDMVEKGEAIGIFAFGGSSGVMVLQRKTVKSSKVGDAVWENIADKWIMGQKIVDLTPA